MKRALALLVLACAACGGASEALVASPSKASSSQCTPVAAPFAPLELVVIGSGGPRGFGRAASSYVVLIDGVARVLIDVGPGAFVRLGEANIDFESLDTVLLTHLHIDHSGDLPGFVKSRDVSFDKPLAFRIFGPTAAGPFPSTSAFVDRLFGDQGAYAYLRSFRNELRFSVVDVPAPSSGEPRELLAEQGLRIVAVDVDHDDVPALAYRIEHAGHAVVVTGDLASKNDHLTRLAMGAEVLVYDTAVLDPPNGPPKLYDLHTPPHRIGEVAAKAGVSTLVLSHLTPAVEKSKDAVRESIGTTFHGRTQFAEDCMRVVVKR